MSDLCPWKISRQTATGKTFQIQNKFRAYYPFNIKNEIVLIPKA